MGFKIRFGVLKYYTEEDGITEVWVPAKVKTIGEKAGKKHNMERACISLLASLALESNQNRIWAILADYKNKTFGFDNDALL